MKYSWKTPQKWHYLYKKDGFDAFLPKTRSDKGIPAHCPIRQSMPRLKPSPEEDRNRIVRAIIVCNQERYALSDESVAKYLHTSLATFRKKKARPVNFDLMDIHALSQYLRFTPVQAASITFGWNITAKEVKDFILM